MDKLKEKGVKVQKIGETVYVYIDKPYWDKLKKQNRHKREYIGKLSENGDFLPNKKYLARLKNEKGKNAVNSRKAHLLLIENFMVLLIYWIKLVKKLVSRLI